MPGSSTQEPANYRLLVNGSRGCGFTQQSEEDDKWRVQ